MPEIPSAQTINVYRQVAERAKASPTIGEAQARRLAETLTDVCDAYEKLRQAYELLKAPTTEAKPSKPPRKYADEKAGE